MRDQDLNTFQGGMMQDAGRTVPQNNTYTYAQNIRIVSSGDNSGETGVVVNINGNEQKISFLPSYITPPELYLEAFNQTYSSYFNYNQLIDIADLEGIGSEYQEVPAGLSYVLYGDILMRLVDCEGVFLIPWTDQDHFYAWLENNELQCEPMEQDHVAVENSPFSPQGICECKGVEYITGVYPETYGPKYSFLNSSFNVSGDGSNSETYTNYKVLGYTTLRDTIVIFLRYDATTGNNTKPITIGSIITYDTIKNNGTYNTIYSAVNLFSNEIDALEAIGRYESEDIQRVYWTDNYSSPKTINIAEPDLENKSVDDLEFSPIINFSKISVERSTDQGTLPAGMYQYCYRLSREDGSQTRFSPITNFAHVLDGTQYWSYNEDPELNNEYSNTTPGQDTNKSLLVKVNNIDPSFDSIEIAAIYSNGLNAVSECILLNKDYIPESGEYKKLHRSMGEGSAILLEDVTAVNIVPNRAKTIEEKDNRLFLGNVSYADSSLQFNAQAFRYARKDGRKYPITAVDNDDQVTTYVQNPDSTNIRTSDDINPYNESVAISQEFYTAPSYKFKKDGITLGGEGPYVSYEFTKKALQGNAGGWSFPDSAPVLEGVLQESPYCTNENNDITPDYKSVYTVSNLKGYQRDEVYRFGIVLYDLQGNPGFVNWIADIKFPDHYDFDHKKRGGIFNYTLAQNYATSSGCNIYIGSNSLSQNNAYANLFEYIDIYDYGYKWGDPQESMFEDLAEQEGYESILSIFKYATEPPAYLGGNLYTLGIEFTVNIPFDLKDKIGGYSIVRVEREQEDKTVLGSGIVNFLQTAGHREDSNSLSELSAYFEEKVPYKRAGGSAYSDANNEKHYNNIFTIDSPDFAFDQTYPSGDCLFVKIAGALNGRTIEGDGNSGAINANHISSIFTSHSLATNAAWLGRVYDISYSSKFERGGHINVSNIDSNIIDTIIEGYDGYVSVSPYGTITSHAGFYNQSWYNGVNVISSLHKKLTGIGEESLFVVTPVSDPSAGELAEIQFHRFMYAPSNSSNTKSKLLAMVKRTLTDQYGGSTFSDRAKNKYISVGHIESNLNKTTSEVWGGDTYVTMYDLEKIRAVNADDGNVDHSGTATSVNFAFPVESTVNTALRGGYHFGNKTDWSAAGEQNLNTFELNPMYSQENKTSVFIPKPINFYDNSSKDTTVVYSQAKIDSEKIDSWKVFKVENSRNLDGSHGSLEKLIVNNELMYFLQSSGFGKLSINPVSTVLDQSGSSIVLGTGSVIQDIQYLSNQIGSQNQRNVVASPRGIYWIDERANKIYAFRANGLESISDTHGVKALVTNLMSADKNKIVAGYDFINSEVLFSIAPMATEQDIDLVGEVSALNQLHSGATLVFNENLNKFTSVYTFTTDLFIDTPKMQFSVDKINAGIFQHNISDNYNWYNNPFISTVEFIVNKNPLNTKVFDSIQWYTEGGGDGQDLITDAEFSTSENTSRFVVFDDESHPSYFPYKQLKEKIARLPIPRTEAGYRFRDTYLKVKLMSHNTGKVILHYVKTLFRISRR